MEQVKSGDSEQTPKIMASDQHLHYLNTVKCLSIGTPKNDKIFIRSKCKIDYF